LIGWSQSCHLNGVALAAPERHHEESAMLTMSFVTDPEHWRERAEDMRLTASSLKDENAKARMLKIAKGYEALRRQTEERITDEPTCAS
jgi:hypothetical protein